MTKYKNRQCLTSGHKTLGVKWLIKHFTSHQGSVSGDKFAAPNSPTFHTADRVCLEPVLINKGGQDAVQKMEDF
jgi:hypothetical protein